MSRVTSKYQITIPSEIRKELGIIPGTDADIVLEGDKYVLIVNPFDKIKKRWRGKFKDKTNTDEYMTEIREEVT